MPLDTDAKQNFKKMFDKNEIDIRELWILTRNGIYTHKFILIIAKKVKSNMEYYFKTDRLT